MIHKLTCKNCKSRYLGCHSECADYRAYRKERNEILDLKNKSNDIQDAINDYRQENYHKVFIKKCKKRRR